MKPALGPWNSQSRRMLTGRTRAGAGGGAAAAAACGAAGAAAGGGALGPAAGPGAQAATRARARTPMPSKRPYRRGSRADMVVLLHSPAPADDELTPAAPVAAWAAPAPAATL